MIGSILVLLIACIFGAIGGLTVFVVECQNRKDILEMKLKQIEAMERWDKE